MTTHPAPRFAGRRAAGFWALGGGLLWILVWLHLLASHGRTQVNEERVALGLTWLDSSRFVLFAILATAVTAGLLLRGAGGRARVAAAVAAAGYLLCSVGIVLGFWLQPWRTYDGASRETGPAALGGGLVAVGSIVLAGGLIATAIVAARRGRLPRWAAACLAVGAVSAVPWLHESPSLGWVLGAAWIVTGLALVVGGEPRPARSARHRWAPR